MQITEQRVQTISLVTLAVIGVGAVLHLLQDVFMPLLLGGFLALGLSSLVNFQTQRLHLPVTLAVTITLCLSLLLFWLGGLVVTASVEQLGSSAAVYEDQLIQLVHGVLGALPLQHLHLSAEQLSAPLQHFPIENIILGITNSFLQALSLALLTFVFTAYLLVLLSRETRTAGVWFEIESRVKGYLVAKIIVSLVVGLIIGLALYFAGVRFALLFGLITGLLNFIPYLGPTVASLVPWPIILLSPELSTATKLFALFFPGTLFFLAGNFFEPKIFGVSVQLHPLAVLLVCMFWGVLWGSLGILLAAPVSSALAMLLSQLEITRPFADLLRGEVTWNSAESARSDSGPRRQEPPPSNSE